MPKKILIVDDESCILTLVTQTLEDLSEAGVDLLTATHGEDAWGLVQSERPDLVILDIMLPDISGYEICRRIKSDPGLSGIHVTMLTAKSQLADRERGLEAGADEFIAKPFSVKQLRQHTADLLGVSV